jgi:hypothetical protein
MVTRPLSRRTLLRGAGGAALALPFLEAMTGPTAVAQTAQPPKRILFYFTGNGFPPHHWRVSTSAETTPTAGLTLSRILAPLDPVKDQCIFIDGLPMLSGLDEKQVAFAHAAGTSTLFTGSYAPPGDMYGGGSGGVGYPLHESVDQTIARAIGGQTRFPAYYVGVKTSGPELLKSVFYTADSGGGEQAKPVTPNSNPYSVRDELFAGFGAGPSDAAWQARRDSSVLDAVLDSARDLRCRLGGSDRARLELHMEQVRAIEQSLDATVSASASCAAVPVEQGLTANQESGFPALARVQSKLLAMALTCDLTRVGGYFFSPALDNPTYTWLGHTVGHHQMTHEIEAGTADPANAYDLVADVCAWHAGELLYLVDLLKNTPEGAGSMLDNTLIWWASECAQTYEGDPHDLVNVTHTLIGGGQGHFKPGQYIKFPGGDKYPHSRLLVTLAQYMGLPVDVVGQPEYCAEGPLPLITV